MSFRMYGRITAYLDKRLSSNYKRMRVPAIQLFAEFEFTNPIFTTYCAYPAVPARVTENSVGQPLKVEKPGHASMSVS